MWVDSFLWSAIGYPLRGEQTFLHAFPPKTGVAQDVEE